MGRTGTIKPQMSDHVKDVVQVAAGNSDAPELTAELWRVPSQLRTAVEWVLECLLGGITPRWALAQAGLSEPRDPSVSIRCSGREESVTLVLDMEQWERAMRPGIGRPDGSVDALAEAFWFLARTEEIDSPAVADAGEDRRDEHGRFRARASSSAPDERPVDELRNRIVTQLGLGGRWRPSSSPRFRVALSHDIDQLARRTRVQRRRLLRELVRSLRHGEVGATGRAMAGAAGMCGSLISGRDPWANLERIAQLEARHGARSTSFFLAAHADVHDGDAASYLAQRGRALAHVRDSQGEVGLHGSYLSSVTAGSLKHERETLEAAAGCAITSHRFHYLRHRPPQTWDDLADAGISADATLGWAEQPGWRAGTALPFRAWSHSQGRPLDLVIVPLAAMDASFDQRYLDLDDDPSAIRATLSRLLDDLAASGGAASILWHNDRLAHIGAGHWHRTWVWLIQEIRSRGGQGTTVADVAQWWRHRLSTSA